MPHLVRRFRFSRGAFLGRNSLRTRGALLLLAATLLAACVTPRQAETPTATITSGAAPDAIVVPKIDRRQYRALSLPNGLRAVVVSDPASDKAAASLVVARGSFDEPADIPGLAHFLEHMLFLGTTKYPEADAYQNFISTNGGGHNAYTAGDHTNYFFDVAPQHFDGALDRFAQFFIAPRFDAAYVAREMNAVNSEYQLQLKDDGWRGNAVEKTALNPAHPMARFNIGSLETLGDRPERSTRSALIAFYETAYAPHEMTLALYGPESLDALEAQAQAKFAAIPRRAGLPRLQLPPLAAPGSLPQRVVLKPERNQHSLTFQFPLPGLDAAYRVGALEYLGNLLGHEGEGSLHALLKSRGWIESLGAGGGRVDADNSILQIELSLTPEGARHEVEIGEALFGYLALLRRDGVQARLYDEQAALARLGFDYAEPGRAQRVAVGIAVNQLYFPIADVLRGPFAMDNFDAALIGDLLARLTPANVLVTVADPASNGAERERWFAVPFTRGPLAADVLARWQAPRAEAAVTLPTPNPFVPTDLALVPAAATTTPSALPAPNGLALWHLADTEFAAPRASLVLRLQSRLPSASARNSAATALLAALLEDELNTFAYPALVAGLSYDVRQDARGLAVTVGGYADKQDVLLARVLTALRDLRIDPERFTRYHTQLDRDWENTRRSRPYEQALAEVSFALVEGRYTPEALRAGLATIDVAALVAYHRELLAGVRADLLVHGNLDAGAATRLGELVGSTLALCGNCAGTAPRVRAVREPRLALRKVEHDDAALVLHVQGVDRSPAERARYGLLAQVLQGPFFDELRTTRQLGYVVGVAPAVQERLPGIGFVVQSPVAGAPDLVTATLDFLAAYRERVAAFDDAGFAAHKAGLLTRLMERDANLGARTARLWADLADDVTSFDTRERIAAAIEAMPRAEFVAFYDAFVARARSQRLVVAVPGKFGGAESLGTALPANAPFVTP